MSDLSDKNKSSDEGKQIKKEQSSLFSCEICGQGFDKSRSLIFHMRRHNNQKVFTCHLCQKEFARSDHLKDHVNRHLNAGNHQCDKCDKVFKRADHLKYHKVNEHGSTIFLKDLRTSSRTKVSNDSKRVQCGECDKTFCDERSLKNHTKIHSTSSTYECPYCTKCYKQKANLNVHIRQHTGAKPYKCEICDESFTTSCKLKTHARKHTGEMPFVCDACGKQFGESHLLKMHMLVHKDLKPFVCPHCGKGFTHSSTLRSHIRTHTGEKPYTCDICQESFAQISSLSYHRKTHTGEKPFVCDICGNRYTRRTTLKLHQAHHIGDKIFSCSQCNFKCDIASQLRKHVLHEHVLKNMPISTQSTANKTSHQHIQQAVQTQTTQNQTQKTTSEKRSLNTFLSSEVFSKIDNHDSGTIYRTLQDDLHQSIPTSLTNVIQEPVPSEKVSGILMPRHDYPKEEMHSEDPSHGLQPSICSNSLVTQTSIFNPALSYVLPSVKMEQSVRNLPTLPPSFDPNGVHPADSHPHFSHPQASFPRVHESSVDLVSPSHQTLMMDQNRIQPPGYLLPLQQVVQADSQSESQIQNTSSFRDKLFMGLVQIQQPTTMNSSIAPIQLPVSVNALLVTPSRSMFPPTDISSTDGFDHQHSNANRNIDSTMNAFSNQNDLIESHNSQSVRQDLVTQRHDKHKSNLASESLDVKETSFKESLSLVSHKNADTDMDDDSLKSGLPPVTSVSMEAEDADLHLNTKNKEIPENSQKIVESSLSILSFSYDKNNDKDDNFPTCDPNKITKQVDPDCSDSKQSHKTTIKLEGLCTKSKVSKKSIPAAKSMSSLNSLSSLHLKSKSRKLNKKADRNHSKNQTKKLKKTYKHKIDKDKNSSKVSKSANHQRNVYSCEYCEEEFDRKGNLTTHTLLNHREKILTCPICCKEFSRSHHLKVHLLLHSKSKELRCYHCSHEFSDTSLLEEHIHSAHNGIYPFKCNSCAFSCMDMLQLKGHVGQAHFDLNLCCPVCGMEAKTSKAFQKHMKQHSGENTIQCHLCNTSCSQVSVLILHLRRKHNAVKHFACGVCLKSYTIAADLQKHLKSHLGDRPFACDICKKAFADSKVLRLHRRIHGNEKQFQCSHCQRRFMDRSTLTSHLRIHTGAKPFVCDVCGNAFSQISTLTAHQQTHNRQKMYVCDLCGKAYTRMATLNLHMLHHKGLRRFPCPLCAFQCNKSKVLKRHMEKCHNKQATDVNYT